MKRLVLAAALFLSTSAAYAEPAQPPAPPPLQPITITVEEYNQLMTFLGSQQFNLAAPLVNFLATKQQAAQASHKK